jgi:hypothetical protein
MPYLRLCAFAEHPAGPLCWTVIGVTDPTEGVGLWPVVRANRNQQMFGAEHSTQLY